MGKYISDFLDPPKRQDFLYAFQDWEQGQRKGAPPDYRGYLSESSDVSQDVQKKFLQDLIARLLKGDDYNKYYANDVPRDKKGRVPDSVQLSNEIIGQDIK